MDEPSEYALEPPADEPPPRKPPGAPLPRIYKSASPPDQADQKSPPKQSKKDQDPKKKDKTSRGKDKDDKPALLEETPTLDTYAARQAARSALGFVAVGMLLLAGFLLWRAFRPVEEPLGELFDEAELDRGQVQVGGAAPELFQGEVPALDLLRRARATTDARQAQVHLERVIRDYPRTAAAREARMALDRAEQGLPLFAEHAIVAQKGEPAPAPAPMPATEVAVAPTPTPVAPTQGTVQAFGPAVQPEPYRKASQIPATPGVAPRPLPEGFVARAEAGVHESGWPLEIVGLRDGAPMVLVPAGTFTRGRDDEAAAPAERPAHPVQMSAYYIDQHEVTVRQYDLYRAEMARRGTPLRPSSEADADPDRPVGMIDAREARAFAVWSGKQLPTEAQWEKAARTTDGRLYPWGSSPPDWGKPREHRQIDPVMSFATDLSPYGVFDLAGNAWEWTNDWYDSRYYQQSGARAANPAGPRSSPSRTVAIKGSSRTWIVSAREGMKVETRYPYLGFRCVLDVEHRPRPPEPPAPTRGAPASTPGGVVPF